MKKNFRFLAMAVVAMAAQCSRDVHPMMISLLRMKKVRFKPAQILTPMVLIPLRLMISILQ